MLHPIQVTPGPYAGDGKAIPLQANGQIVVWNAQAITAGTTTSLAVQLERKKAPYYYPWGAAVQVTFSGTPGTFSIGVQFSETDTDASYVTVGTITAVNGSNVGRYDMPNTVYPQFIRLIGTTLTNVVTATAVITR